jgi:hypothetical protein
MFGQNGTNDQNLDRMEEMIKIWTEWKKWSKFGHNGRYERSYAKMMFTPTSNANMIKITININKQNIIILYYNNVYIQLVI